MCTPHDLINSDLLGKNREPHFGHKGSDLALFRRNYWFKFWSYERKNGFSAKCVENSGSWFLEQEVLRLGRMLEENKTDTVVPRKKRQNNHPTKKPKLTKPSPKHRETEEMKTLWGWLRKRTGQHEQGEKEMKRDVSSKRRHLREQRIINSDPGTNQWSGVLWF